MDDTAATPTPRETRLRLLKMERWYRRHESRYTPEDRVFLRLAFEYAERPQHADVIAASLRAGANEKKDCLPDETRVEVA